MLDNIYSAFHLYVLRIEQEKVTKSHKEIFKNLRDFGIMVNLHYIPVYYHPYYRDRFGFLPGYCPNAERYYEEAISIPMYPQLTDDEIIKVVDACKKSIK